MPGPPERTTVRTSHDYGSGHPGWPGRATRQSFTFVSGKIGVAFLPERARLCLTCRVTINAPGPAPTVDPARLASQHLPLVAHLVHDTLRRVPAAVDRHDLLAVGVDALLAAAREPTVERPFAEHASVRIRAALVEELRAIDWAARAEHPRHAASARARPLAALADLPDAGAAARVLDVDLDPAEAQEGSPALVGGTTRPAHPDRRDERREYVEAALDELPERLRLVVRGYFVEQRPMAAVAAQAGASEARAVQLLVEGLGLLRDALALAFGPSADTGPVTSTRAASYARTVAARYAARPVRAPREEQRTSA